MKVNCQTFSKLSRLPILSDQHGFPDSRNLFCKMLRTTNEEMKHGGTMTDHGQRESYSWKEECQQSELVRMKLAWQEEMKKRKSKKEGEKK